MKSSALETLELIYSFIHHLLQIQECPEMYKHR